MATATAASNDAAPPRPRRAAASIACSICATASENCNSSSAITANNGNGNGNNSTTTHQASHQYNSRRANHHLPIRIALDASFVNIPQHSHHLQSDLVGAALANNNNGLERNNVHDIESILEDALHSSSSLGGGGGGGGGRSSGTINGGDMQEASRRMDAFYEHAMALLLGDKELKEGYSCNKAAYCQSCLDRIATAMETLSERLDEECIAYDAAATAEEERTSLLFKVISMNSDASGGLALDDCHDDDDDDAADAIHRAIDSFQYELDTLQNACNEQEAELGTLQNLMQDQTVRSNAISEQEDSVHQELNALEIDARNFGEESRLVSNSCSAVETEIDAMSRVKLMSIPFDIRVADWDDDDDDDDDDDLARDASSSSGRYPTINDLRLAYRINEKADLRRDEINAAFSNAAQLLAFALGLHPALIDSTIRIIPVRPCAKIVVNLPEGQSIHSLGFDAADHGVGESNHVPTKSITLFLVLLSQISSHVVALTDRNVTGVVATEPPFRMTEFSIDNVDLTKLADSNTAAWSSVVFCIAANLRWLSEIEIGQPCV